MSSGRGPDGDGKDRHVSFRVDAETAEYIDSFADMAGFVSDDGSANRSAALRAIIKSHHGVLFGNFFGVVDHDKLSDEWGDVGHLLAASLDSDDGVPDTLDEARMADILEPIPVLVTAADVELGGVEGVSDE